MQSRNKINRSNSNAQYLQYRKILFQYMIKSLKRLKIIYIRVKLIFIIFHNNVNIFYHNDVTIEITLINRNFEKFKIN